MADAALFGRRSNDKNLAQMPQLLFERRQSGCKNTVVVGQENTHGLGSFGRYRESWEKHHIRSAADTVPIAAPWGSKCHFLHFGIASCDTRVMDAEAEKRRSPEATSDERTNRTTAIKRRRYRFTPVNTEPLTTQSIVVLDFGSQYAQLIARRVREQNVYCQILRHDISAERIAELPRKA